jgi:hypothetical protein
MGIKKFNEYHINEGLGDGKISMQKAKKYVDFFNKIKYLFIDVDIHFSFEEIFNFIKTGDKNIFNKNIYNDIHSIVNDNKNEIQQAYDAVFATNEGCGGLIISVLFALAFYYAFSRGWFEGLFSKVDRVLHRTDTYGKSKNNWEKVKPQKRSPEIKKEFKSKTDQLLDKINSRGINSLTSEEKEYLRKNN